MPTSLPPTREPERTNLDGLGADAWAGIAVVVAMFIFGVAYWSGHTNDTSATAAPTLQAMDSSVSLKDAATEPGVKIR